MVKKAVYCPPLHPPNKAAVADVRVCRIDVKWCMML